MKSFFICLLTIVAASFSSEKASAATYISVVSFLDVATPGQALDKALSLNRERARKSDQNCQLPGWVLVQRGPIQIDLDGINSDIIRVTQILVCVGF